MQRRGATPLGPKGEQFHSCDGQSLHMKLIFVQSCEMKVQRIKVSLEGLTLFFPLLNKVFKRFHIR